MKDPDPSLYSQILKLDCNFHLRNTKQGTSPPDQQFPGQKTVPLTCRLRENIEQATADPVFRIRSNSNPAGNLVSRRKSDSPDIFRQPVRIDLHNLIELNPVSLPDPRRVCAPDSVFLQKNHGIAQIFFVLHLRPDLTGNTHTDSLDLRKLLRLLLHYPERIITKPPDNLCRHGLAYSLDTPGRQIAVHGLCILRRNHPVILHTELLSVNRMRDILTRNRAALPLADRDRIPHTSDHITKQITRVNYSRLPGFLLRTFNLPLGTNGLPLRAFSLPLGTISLPLRAFILSFGNFSLPLGTNGLPLRAFILSFGNFSLPLGTNGLPIRPSQSSVTGDRFSPIKGPILPHIRESHFKYSVSTVLTAINDMRNKALKISHHPSLCSIQSF